MRQTSYRRIAAELPELGTQATTRSGQVGVVIAHEDGQARLQFSGCVQGLYDPAEITWQVVGAQTEGHWQTEGAGFTLADRDYPELEDILGKPAPSIVQQGDEWGKTASKTADFDDGDEWEPDEDDAFIQDVVRGGYDVSIDGKFLDHFDDRDEAEAAIKAWMEHHQFWPNVWTVSDHGNLNLITLSKIAYDREDPVCTICEGHHRERNCPHIGQDLQFRNDDIVGEISRNNREGHSNVMNDIIEELNEEEGKHHKHHKHPHLKDPNQPFKVGAAEGQWLVKSYGQPKYHIATDDHPNYEAPSQEGDLTQSLCGRVKDEKYPEVVERNNPNSAIGDTSRPGFEDQWVCKPCQKLDKQRTASKTAGSLNDQMDFDHVVQVLPGGQVVDAPGVYAPTLMDDSLDDSSWSLLDGYSGQSGYSGPIMHASEFIGGGLERDILDNPGYYVNLVNYLDDGDEPEGWAVAYKPAPTTAAKFFGDPHPPQPQGMDLIDYIMSNPGDIEAAEDTYDRLKAGTFYEDEARAREELGKKADSSNPSYNADWAQEVRDMSDPEFDEFMRSLKGYGVEQGRIDAMYDTRRTAAQGDWNTGAFSTRFPGEITLSCPKCGSTDVTMTGSNLGSDVVRGNNYAMNICRSCGYRDSWPIAAPTAAKQADSSNPNGTDDIFHEVTYDPYGSFEPKPGDCPTCFGEGAYSDLNPDGRGFGLEHECASCGGTGKAS